MLDPMTVKTAEGARVTTLDAHALAELTVADADSYRGSRQVDLRVVEDLDPFTAVARVLLEVDGRVRLAPTAAQWRAIGHGALESADLLDAQPAPALTAA